MEAIPNIHSASSSSDKKPVISISDEYIEWAVRRYPNQFSRVSRELLRPNKDLHDLVLEKCINVRDRIYATFKSNG